MGDNKNKTAMLTIGRLARAAGIGVPTVRYYQRRGLLREPPKPPTGRFRCYDDQDLSRLLLIRQSKELGFTLAEIAQLIMHIEAKDCQAFRTITREKLDAVDMQIRVLNRRKKALSSVLNDCTTGCSNNCPLYKRFMKCGKKAKS